MSVHAGEPSWQAHLAAMLRARRFDEELIRRADLIEGVYHVSIGMEATAAALALARRPEDLIMLNHRNHGPLAAIGSDLETMYREIFGRDGGPQRGRGGTLHLADPSLGVPYTSAMVGGGVALAVGLALGKRVAGESGIAFALFGDGAMGEGAVYEALNLAQLWQAPVLFLCESNSEPASGRANAAQAAVSLAALAEVHQMPAVTLEASRPGELAEVLAREAGLVRDGGGPRFVEARSAPWPGNAGFLPSLAAGAFKLEQAIDGEGWADLDPVARQVRALAQEGVALEQIDALDVAVREQVARACAAAASAPRAGVEAAMENVWA